jgi:hypothetical protein
MCEGYFVGSGRMNEGDENAGIWNIWNGTMKPLVAALSGPGPRSRGGDGGSDLNNVVSLFRIATMNPLE